MQAVASPAVAGKASRGPILPREHGGWAMLLIPLVVGLAVAGRWGWEGPLFLGTCLALYVSRLPLTMLARVLREPRGQEWARPLLWLVIYGALALIFALALLYLFGRWFLIPWAGFVLAFSAAHFYLRGHGLDRTPGGELVTIAGLALTAPGAYYVARGSLEPTALYLWALTSLYSGSSVFYVRMKMKHRALRRPARNLGERLALGRANILYDGLLVLVLATAALGGQAPYLVPLAFAPLLAKVTYAILRGGPEVNIKRVGWVEVAHSVAFTFLLIGTYLVSPPL